MFSLRTCNNLNPPSTGVVEYFVSNNGSVSNTGRSSLSPIPPSSLSGVSFSTATRLNFNRGETFEIAYTAPSNNLYFDAYGSGPLPVFSGSTPINGLVWTNEGDGNYSTPMTEPDMIYINGLRAKLSETPWITITSYPATNQLGINNNDVSGYGTITGSRLNLKSRPWTTEYMYTVSNYASSVITLNQATAVQTSIVGTTFKLLGKKAYLSANNEWAWEGNKLYIKSTVSPAALNIRKSVFRTGISIPASLHHISINNISFKDYYYSAIKRADSDKVTIQNCTIQNCSGYGIVMTGNPMTAVIEDNEIFNCDGGIYDAACYNININRNRIYNISVGGNVGAVVDYSLVQAPNKAIFCRDLSSSGVVHTNGEVSYNTIYNCASTGIQIQSKFKCHHNIIHDFMTQFSDGSAIYSVASSTYTTSLSEIYNNIIYNGSITFVAGIYVDNRSISFDIHDNVIYNVLDAGINVNWDTQFTSIRNNIIVDCGGSIRYRQGGTFTAYEFTEGNVCTGNIFALRSASQYCHKAEVFDGAVNYNPFNNGGSSNNNKYISPYINRVGYHTDNNSMTFGSLKSRYGSDAQSTQRVNYKTYVNQAQAEIDVLLLTNETENPISRSLDSGYINVDGNSISQVSVPPYGGVVVLKS